MERRALSLLGVTYANAVAREIQNLRREICCGCKTYEQDCFMMTEEEGWDMHGMTAIERVNAHHSVWHELLNVLGILNIEVDKEFADHLMEVQKDPDRYSVWDLLQLHMLCSCNKSQNLLQLTQCVSRRNEQTCKFELRNRRPKFG